MKRIALLVAAAMTLGSCAVATEPKIPEAFLTGAAAAAGLQFSVDVTPKTIHMGDTAVMVIHLLNPRLTTARITFSTGCEVLPYISAGQSTLVYPPASGWTCTQAQTVLQISGTSEFRRVVTIRGGPPAQTPFSGAALTPGTFVAYAELGDDMGRSNAVVFSVTK